MKRGKANITFEVLEKLLGFPEGVKIRYVRQKDEYEPFDRERVFSIYFEGDELPQETPEHMPCKFYILNIEKGKKVSFID